MDSLSGIIDEMHAVCADGLLLLCAVLVTMGLDKETWQISWIVGVPWLALLTVGYFLMKARLRRLSA